MCVPDLVLKWTWTWPIMNFEEKKEKIQNESFTEITFTEIRVPKRTFTEISEISTEIHLRVPKSAAKAATGMRVEEILGQPEFARCDGYLLSLLWGFFCLLT